MSHPATVIVPQLARSLAQLPVWIDKTEAWAAERKFDANVLLAQRLFPDMFPLSRQIGTACDTAKLCVSRLTGVQAPAHADTETTWTEVRARVDDVLGWLDAHKDASFDKADEARIRFGWLPGHSLGGRPYLVQWVMPNFYFHMGMSYAILRSHGVPLGKAEYMGAVPFEADRG
jgi:hypothetical protein